MSNFSSFKYFCAFVGFFFIAACYARFRSFNRYNVANCIARKFCETVFELYDEFVF